MSKWVEVGPAHDYPTASWGDVWWLFKRALTCTVRGHRYGIDWQDIPADGPPTTRYCDRCNRDWVWLSCEH